MTEQLPHRRLGRALLAGLVLTATGLATVAPAMALKVKTRHVPGTDFSALETYVFKPWPAATTVDADTAAVRQRIRQAIAGELADDGLRAAGEGEQADVVVVIEGFIQEEGMVPDLSRDQIRWLSLDEDPAIWVSVPKQEGVLVVEIRGAESGELLWAGWASDKAKTRQKLLQGVEKMAAKIFRAYPPKD